MTLVASGGVEYLRAQAADSFDLVYADAKAGKYKGLEEALRVVKPSGCFVIDDMLPQSNWPEGHAAKTPMLMDQLARNTQFSMVPIVWASGVVVAVRRFQPKGD